MVAKKTSKRGTTNGAKSLREFNLGDVVEIRHSNGQRGRIVEFRGPLGPKGANVYRIRLKRKPKAAFVELPEDQLTRIQVEARS